MTERHDFSKSASIGIWVKVGTRDESSKHNGISHLLEHMVFKGTKSRSSFEIARSLEILGGELNAYTSREYTCYHALVLGEHWEKALDVLTDLVSNMQVSERDFRREKTVVQQEIAMSIDNNEDYIFDQFFMRQLPNHPLGWSILGTVETLDNIKHSDLKRFYKEHYTGNQIIVSAAGQIDHDLIVKSCEKHLKHKKKTKPKKIKKAPKFTQFIDVIDKPSEQLHLLLGLPATSFTDGLRFEAFILNAVLGGGVTSKIYQSVREKRGLAYSVYSLLNTYIDSGGLLIYAGTELQHFKDLYRVILREMNKLKLKGVSQGDIKVYKTQVKGSLLLGVDDVDNRMSSLAINEMIFNKYKSVEGIIESIEAINKKTMQKYMDQYFDLNEMSALLLGGGSGELRDWLVKETLK